MAGNLNGDLCASPKACKNVLYWWIVSTPLFEIGVSENLFNLDVAINAVGGQKIVYAFSGGARTATAWLTDRAHRSSVPARDLSFVLIGNGTRKYGGFSTWLLGGPATAPRTQYAVIDVAREYDPIADFPANPFNLLAMANALSAFSVIHMNYSGVDIDAPGNYVWSEDNTTYVFVPTANLPLLQPLRDLGLGFLADQWEAPLRAIIDRAYTAVTCRNSLKALREQTLFKPSTKQHRDNQSRRCPLTQRTRQAGVPLRPVKPSQSTSNPAQHQEPTTGSH